MCNKGSTRRPAEGRQPSQYQHSYYLELRLMITLTIKINDEFGLLDTLEGQA